MVAQQTDLALHDQIDALARIGTVADQVAEAVDLGDSLAADIGKHGLKGLDVAVEIADEGSFHACMTFGWNATREI
jgi:hypothetical protein